MPFNDGHHNTGGGGLTVKILCCNNASHEVHVIVIALDGVRTCGGEVNKKTLVIGTQIGTDKCHDIDIMIGT